MQESHDAVRRFFEKCIAVFIFVLVLAFYPFTGDPTGDIKAFLTACGALFLGSAWLFAGWWNNIPLRKPVVFAWPLACLLALYALATLFSSYRMVSVLETGRFVSLVMLYFVASQVYTNAASVQRLLKTLVLASVAATAYGFLQLGGFDQFLWDAVDVKTDVYTGLPATYGNPNFAAHVMVLTLPIAVYLFARERRWVWLVAALVTLVHLRMTGQRASYIALAGAITLAAVVWAVLRRRREPARAIALSFGVWLLIGLGGVLAGMGLLAWRTGSPLPLDTSLHIRYWSYVSATKMIQDAPVLGHGPGVYGFAYHKYWTQLEKEWFVQETRKNKHVHNDLMEIAIDAGMPAAGLYLLLLVLGIGHGIAWAVRAGPGERMLGVLFAALFAGFLLDGLFGFNLRVPVSAAYLFLLIGALEGLVSRPGVAVEERAWPLPGTGAVLVLTAIALLVTCDFAALGRLFTGERALSANRLDVAKREFTDGEVLAPWNARFALQMSKVYYLKGEADRALQELDRMFEIDPNYFPARLTQARYHIQLAQKALATSPMEIRAPVDHLAAASDSAKAVLAVCDRHPVAEKLLGRAAAATAMAITTAEKASGAQRARLFWEEAEKDLEGSLRGVQEEKAETYRLLAQVKLALGKPVEAEQAFGHAARNDPGDPATWGQFLAFANGNKRYERIRNTLVATIGTLNAEKPPRKDVLALVRMCLANVRENGYGDYERAAEDYRAAAEGSPLSPEVWSNYARFAFQRGRAEELKISLKEAQGKLIQDGTEIPAQLRVVFAAFQPNTKAWEDASSVLVAQVRSYPKEAKLSVQQTYEWTARLLREVVETTPADQNAIARLNLGIVYSKFKEYPTADALFAASKGHVPESLAVTHVAMWSEVLLELNRGQEAIEMIEPLRVAYPGNFDLRHAYARALVKVGRLPEGKMEYLKLLAEPTLGNEGRLMIQAEADELN